MALSAFEYAAEEFGEALGRWSPQAYQLPPPGRWRRWLFMGGRGTGKTDSIMYEFDKYMRNNAGHRGRIIGPTLGDVRESCIDGISGLKVHNPDVKFNTNTGVVTWPNGSRAKIFGAYTPDDVERLRAGGNSFIDAYEEMAAWRMMQQAYQQADLGLRLGDWPHAIIATTPKPRVLIKELVALAATDPSEVVLTKASTRDNMYLDPAVRARYERTYGGTRLGRQELEAEILEDVEGALWNMEQLEALRLDEAPVQMRRIVVAVDPSWGTTHDECGIVVVGLGWDRRGYVLDDCSMRAAPSEWGAAVAAAYRRWEADRVIAETNFQAEQVRLVMKTTDPSIPFKEMNASRGKQQRAEPVVALYEQGRVSHISPNSRLAGLERQMCDWVPPEPGHKPEVSPDRIDALVWGVTELMLSKAGPARVSSAASVQMPGVVSVR